MFELRVLTGLHQGAALPLVGAHWLIGADDELDLALHDPSIAPRHCRLHCEGDAWTLVAENGTVVDNEGHGHPQILLQPNAPFVLGSVWLVLCEAGEPWPAVPVPVAGASAQANAVHDPAPTQRTAPRLRPSFFNRITLVIMGTLVGVVGSAWSLSYHATPGETSLARPATEAAMTAEPQRPTEEARASANATNRANPQRALLSADEATKKLATMLSDRLLTDVTIEQTPKAVVLHGNLQKESQLVLKRMLQRFDDRYQSMVEIVDRVSLGGSSLPFVIVQIMSGPQAHLVTADGRRVYIGDELDGLRLTRIDDGRVEFEGDRHYEVSW